MLRASSRIPSPPHEFLCLALGYSCFSARLGRLSTTNYHIRALTRRTGQKPPRLRPGDADASLQGPLPDETEAKVGHRFWHETDASKDPLQISKGILRPRPLIPPLVPRYNQYHHPKRFMDAVGSEDEVERLLSVLAMSSSPDECWDAFQKLLTIRSNAAESTPLAPLPTQHLHRLARVLMTEQPRTQLCYTRLRSVLTVLQQGGGRIQRWEWNALIDATGRGWRKTTLADYHACLKAFDLMTTQVDIINPVEGLSGGVSADIWTYNTLLACAARTGSPSVIQHAGDLLQKASHITPDHITQLTVLPHLIRRGNLSAIRDIMKGMAAQNRYFEIDGINAYVWALVRDGHFYPAIAIYRKLKTNQSLLTEIQPPTPPMDHEDDALFVGPDLSPNGITYTILIQALSYHGRMMDAMKTFRDMLIDPTSLASKPPTKRGSPTALMPIYRALFMGFARFGACPEPKPFPPALGFWSLQLQERLCHRTTTVSFGGDAEDTRVLPGIESTPESSLWTINALEPLFNNFLQISMDEGRPNERTIFWIMCAFARTSGNDITVLADVWDKLEGRFGQTMARGRLALFARSAKEVHESQSV